MMETDILAHFWAPRMFWNVRFLTGKPRVFPSWHGWAILAHHNVPPPQTHGHVRGDGVNKFISSWVGVEGTALWLRASTGLVGHVSLAVGGQQWIGGPAVAEQGMGGCLPVLRC